MCTVQQPSSSATFSEKLPNLLSSEEMEPPGTNSRKTLRVVEGEEEGEEGEGEGEEGGSEDVPR